MRILFFSSHRYDEDSFRAAQARGGHGFEPHRDWTPRVYETSVWTFRVKTGKSERPSTCARLISLSQ